MGPEETPGELVTAVDRLGRRIDFRHDASHRVVSETWDMVPPRVTTHEYNGAGQLVRVEDPDSAITIGDHPTGKIASIDAAASRCGARIVSCRRRC